MLQYTSLFCNTRVLTRCVCFRFQCQLSTSYHRNVQCKPTHFNINNMLNVAQNLRNHWSMQGILAFASNICVVHVKIGGHCCYSHMFVVLLYAHICIWKFCSCKKSIKFCNLFLLLVDLNIVLVYRIIVGQ